jgi:excisionase family DNA binding protein
MLTAKQLAERLGVHTNYIYGLATSKRLPSYRIGGNRRFRCSEVETWLLTQRP